jgi:sphinganine-1-phosphate aldolase
VQDEPSRSRASKPPWQLHTADLVHGHILALERSRKRRPKENSMPSSELDTVLEALRAELRPYRGSHPTFARLPTRGRPREEILTEMRDFASAEEPAWRDGFVSGAVYDGAEERIEFLNEVYAINSQSNPLHPELWPSAVKYEAEIVGMTASMLGGGEEGVASVCGAVTSGGTESILLAMKTYRDRARAERRRLGEPEMLVPLSAHAAFGKAAQYFGLRLVPIPLGPDWRADVAAASKLLNRNTVVVVGSAPGYPHGVVDPIEELSELARSHNVGFHVDSCLGGFVLPWARRLDYDVPPFDFTLPGVTSMSVDTDKFGYAPKGTSVVLYRDHRIRRYQYYKTASWMGGLYFSSTFAGSRPGALSAECWAAMLALGEDGYMAATRSLLETAAEIRRGIEGIAGLDVLGDPLWVIAFSSGVFDIYAVMDRMGHRGWRLNGLQNPPAARICVTLRHAQRGVASRFLSHLEESVTEVRSNPGVKGSMAPVYGMAGAHRTRGSVEELLEAYGDVQFEV